MTASVVGSQRAWSGERDDDGHRTWMLQSYVRCTSFLDGPAVVMQCGGLPQIGSTWNFGNDVDVWAFCYPYMKVSPLPGANPNEDERFLDWLVEQKFSTKPLKRCNTSQIENPLDEPYLISGNFLKYTKEANYDRFGNQIRTSSFEQVHGPNVEFDFNRPTVKISWNVANLNLRQLSTFIDTVNDSTLWGMPRRCVKLSNCSFERRQYGICNFYFNQAFEFDTDWNTFDKNVLDEGYKCLNGQWAISPSDPDLTTWRNGVALPSGSLWKLLPIGGVAPNRNNPQHYMRYKDKNGEMNKVVLDGRGEPCATGFQPADWEALTQYKIGTYVYNAGNIYLMLSVLSPGTSNAPTVGTSGTAPGPTGSSGPGITDGNCIWGYTGPYTAPGLTPGNIPIQYYPESNMLLLGIPTSLTG